jgi:hypothetical protein
MSESTASTITFGSPLDRSCPEPGCLAPPGQACRQDIGGVYLAGSHLSRYPIPNVEPSPVFSGQHCFCTVSGGVTSIGTLVCCKCKTSLHEFNAGKSTIACNQPAPEPVPQGAIILHAPRDVAAPFYGYSGTMLCGVSSDGKSYSTTPELVTCAYCRAILRSQGR